MTEPKMMTDDDLMDVCGRAARWEAVPFDTTRTLGEYIRKVNAAHEWPGVDERDENRIEVDEQADWPDATVAAMLVDALRLAARDRANLLAHIGALEEERRQEALDASFEDRG